MKQYQSVDPSYKTLLRLVILIDVLLLLMIITAATYLVPALLTWHGVGVAVLLLSFAGVLGTVVVPRRFRLTGYQLQPGVVQFRTGAFWRAQTAVTLNRIQHVEITQGPLERLLGLARLVIYTAGGKGSDLIVPGLAQLRAEAIRDSLLQRIDQHPSGDAAGNEGAVDEPV